MIKKFMKKKIVIGSIAVVFIITIIAALMVWQSNKTKEAPTGLALPTARVTRGEVSKSVYASGVIAEEDAEEIKPEAAAKVTKVYVKKGDAVKAGDLLFAMDEGNSPLILEQEHLNVQNKTRELERAVSEAKSDVITSSVSGHLSSWLVKEGDKVDKDTIVAEITDTTKLQISAPFGTNALNKIKAGQRARIFLTNSYSYMDALVSEVDSRGRAGERGGMVFNVTVTFSDPGAVQLGTDASIDVFSADGTYFSSVENGKVERLDPYKIRAGLNGTILHLSIKEGRDIKKNAVMAKVDITETKQLVKDRQLELQQAQLAKEIKVNETSKFKVYAARSGIITELHVEEGQTPPQDKPSIVISGAKGLQMLAKVDELDVPYLHTGQRASIYANSFADKDFPGVITETASQGTKDGSAVVFETKVHIDAFEGLRVGMTGDVAIVVDKREKVLRLPLAAVIIDEGTGTVMIQGEKGPEARDVKTGLAGDEFIEILTGLKEGDEVILNPGTRN